MAEEVKPGIGRKGKLGSNGMNTRLIGRYFSCLDSSCRRTTLMRCRMSTGCSTGIALGAYDPFQY
jgi:hypothetical protein